MMRTTSTTDTESPGDAEAPVRPEDGPAGRAGAGFVRFPAREGVVATRDMVDALRATGGV